MSANVWNPGADILSVNANTTLLPQLFIATEGQRKFNITAFQYTPGTGSLLVFRNGQLINTGIIEDSYTSFSISSADLSAGDEILAYGFVGISASIIDLTAQFSHALSYPAGSIGDRQKQLVTVKDAPFLAKGDGSTDDTAALIAALNYCKAQQVAELYIPEGIYLYTDLGNIAHSGLTIRGAGSAKTILKCISNTIKHTALDIDAFASGLPSDPYITSCNLMSLTVEGNANTLSIIQAQGLARCIWNDVNARVARHTDGVAFRFKGCHINNFTNLMCSTDLAPMSSAPYTGILLTHGYRAGVDQGRCTANVFIHAVMEGPVIGTNVDYGDMNTFIGGTDESCTYYGMVVSDYSRFNVCLGRGFESVAATADIIDSGEYNQFINCYSLTSVILQSRGTKISGGLYERIEIQSDSTKCCVENIDIKYVGGINAGWFDSGIATEWKNLYDRSAGTYIYPFKPRVNITVGESPFTWTNTTGQYVEVILQTGTISQVTRTRPNDSTWLAPTVIPQTQLLAPTEAITVTYSVTPVMSYLPHNSFQG